MNLSIFEQRVHGFHTDLYGHVNNARYLEILEAARWQLLREVLDVDEWHRKGRLFVVVRIDISYRFRAGLGDDLVIESQGGDLGRTSGKVRQRIVRKEDGREVVEAEVTYVVVDAESGRPLRMEGEIAETLLRMKPDGERKSR